MHNKVDNLDKYLVFMLINHYYLSLFMWFVFIL